MNYTEEIKKMITEVTDILSKINLTKECPEENTVCKEEQDSSSVVNVLCENIEDIKSRLIVAEDCLDSDVKIMKVLDENIKELSDKVEALETKISILSEDLNNFVTSFCDEEEDSEETDDDEEESTISDLIFTKFVEELENYKPQLISLINKLFS